MSIVVQLTRLIRDATYKRSGGPLSLLEARDIVRKLLNEYNIEEKPRKYIIEFKPRPNTMNHDWIQFSHYSSSNREDAQQRVKGLSNRNQNFEFRYIKEEEKLADWEKELRQAPPF